MTQTLSDTDIQNALVGYLEGNLSLPELQKELHGYISIAFNAASGERKIDNLAMPETLEIQVSLKHIRAMLEKYIYGNISVEELTDWAAYIYMLPSYVLECKNEDARSDVEQSVTWDVIQELANPNILNTLNETSARAYLERLK